MSRVDLRCPCRGCPVVCELPGVLCPEAARRVRGDLSEQRVAEVLTREGMPWWFLWPRPATERENHLGIDRVVYTHDVGRILLQVKSSAMGEAHFHDHSRRWGRSYRIHVVVVRPDMEPAVVLGRVLAACVAAREEAFAEGTTADDPRLVDRAAVAA